MIPVPFDTPYADTPRLEPQGLTEFDAADWKLALSAEHNPFPRGPIHGLQPSAVHSHQSVLADRLRQNGITKAPDVPTVYALDIDGDGDLDHVIHSERYGKKSGRKPRRNPIPACCS
jgi:hypothetical protein